MPKPSRVVPSRNAADPATKDFIDRVYEELQHTPGEPAAGASPARKHVDAYESRLGEFRREALRVRMGSVRAREALRRAARRLDAAAADLAA